MLLHFIFVIKDKDLGLRAAEFEYVKKMAQFLSHGLRPSFLLTLIFNAMR